MFNKYDDVTKRNIKMICIYVMSWMGLESPKRMRVKTTLISGFQRFHNSPPPTVFCLLSLSLSVSVSVSFHNQTTKQNSIPLNFPLPPNRTSLIAAGKIQFPPGVKKIAHRLLYLGGSLRRWYRPKTLIGYPN